MLRWNRVRQCHRLEGVRVWFGLVVTAFVAASCGGHQSDRPIPTPISYCGQSVTAPVVTEQGRQTLSATDLPHVPAPTASDLPPFVASDSPSIDGWSNLLVLSPDCDHGVTVEIASSPGLRTVGIAYARNHSGLTALILGRLSNASDALHSVRVLAFQGTRIVGQAELVL